MSITKEQIIKAISEMSINNVIELIADMEKKFGVSANISTNTSNNVTQKTQEEKTEFNVILKSIGPNKVAVIKAVRSATGLGLKESKDLVESSPTTIKENLPKDDAENLKKILIESGADAHIK